MNLLSLGPLVFAAGTCLMAQMPSGHTHMAPPAGEKVEAPDTCEDCGMNRTQFAHSRMLIVYQDGLTSGTCSIHCTAHELEHSEGKPVKSLLVADYAHKQKLVDAKKAVWVLGGSQKGVMTKEAKWAFEKKEDAEVFITMNGGKLATFEEVLALAAHEPMH
jgi:copper chaperone NosL